MASMKIPAIPVVNHAHRTAAALALIFAMAWIPQPQASDKPLLLMGAWLIDGTGAPLLSDAWVRIEGDRIIDFADGSPPVGVSAEVIDLDGKTLLPGLADIHFHFSLREEWPWQVKFALAHGATILRDTGIGTAYVGMPEGESRWQCDGLAKLPPAQRAPYTAEHHSEVLQWARS